MFAKQDGFVFLQASILLRTAILEPCVHVCCRVDDRSTMLYQSRPRGPVSWCLAGINLGCCERHRKLLILMMGRGGLLTALATVFAEIQNHFAPARSLRVGLGQCPCQTSHWCRQRRETICGHSLTKGYCPTEKVRTVVLVLPPWPVSPAALHHGPSRYVSTSRLLTEQVGQRLTSHKQLRQILVLTGTSLSQIDQPREYWRREGTPPYFSLMSVVRVGKSKTWSQNLHMTGRK